MHPNAIPSIRSIPTSTDVSSAMASLFFSLHLYYCSMPKHHRELSDCKMSQNHIQRIYLRPDKSTSSNTTSTATPFPYHHSSSGSHLLLFRAYTSAVHPSPNEMDILHLLSLFSTFLSSSSCFSLLCHSALHRSL